MNNIESKYKGKIKTPMDRFITKDLFDLCIKTESALYEKGYIHSKNHEFILNNDNSKKCWLYFMEDHIIWSKSDMSSYYIIKGNTDIESSIKGRSMDDIREEKLKLIYGYDSV